MSKISPLAFIDPEAKIGENCEIGPFCFIDKNVTVGDNNVLMNSVTLLSGTRLGSGNTLFPGAVIGAIPQDLKFKGEDSIVQIGDNNKIRENVTIHRGTASKGMTIVGSNNLIMENAHIAHDCEFGSGIIMGNSTKLAGEVIVDDNAIISAVVLVHQFCRIGGYVMVQGGTRTSQDIPPFIMAGREPVAFAGLNIIGLRRRGFSREVIDNITHAYRLIYQCNLTAAKAIEAIREEVPMSKEIEYIIEFVSNSKRGIVR
jgi:UDP-N-acetylglucosamine acyltransferase